MNPLLIYTANDADIVKKVGSVDRLKLAYKYYRAKMLTAEQYSLLVKLHQVYNDQQISKYLTVKIHPTINKVFHINEDIIKQELY